MTATEARVEMSESLRRITTGEHPGLLCHRGFGRGSVAENTAAAVRAAAMSHADIVEVDVIRSSDGEFFLFHDGQEPRHFDDGAPVSGRRLFELTAEEIGTLSYQWQLEGLARVERLEDVLTALPDIPLQIDRSWRWWPELFPVLRSSGRLDTLHLKSPVNAEALRALEAEGPDLQFAAIISSLEEIEQVKGYDINLVGYELLAESLDAELADRELIERLKAEGRYVQLNALTLPEGQILFAGLDDHLSITEGPDAGWGRILDFAPSLLQTDWPHLVWEYMRSR